MVQKDTKYFCPRIETYCPHKISKNKNICFIMMDYKQLHSKNIEKMLKNATKSKLRLKPLLAKGIKKRGSTDVFCTRICKPIQESTYCIIDVTYINTNVGIEYATAQGFQKPVIITRFLPKLKLDISRKDKIILDKLREKGVIQYSEMPNSVPSDITGIFFIEYISEKELKDKLKEGFEVK